MAALPFVVAKVAIKTVKSELYKGEVKAMNAGQEFEYLGIADVQYHYDRIGRLFGTKGLLSRGVHEVKQGLEGDGERRILTVVRHVETRAIQVVLLIRPANSSSFDPTNPLNCCTIDSNLRTNKSYRMVELKDTKIQQTGPTTFFIEDVHHRVLQSRRKVLKVTLLNTAGSGGWDSVALGQILADYANTGNVPVNRPVMVNTSAFPLAAEAIPDNTPMAEAIPSKQY